MYDILKASGLVFLNSKNYSRWQYSQFRRYVGKSVLEIGCGLGNLTQYLIKDAEYVLASDILPEAVEFAKQRFPGAKNLEIVCKDLFKQGLKGCPRANFDTIIISNVLEHIENDLAAMRSCYDMLGHDGGRLLLLVPAHRFLYGTLDIESGHFRRYAKGALIDLARNANFKIIDLYAFNFIGAIGWFINYRVLRLKNTNNSPSTLESNIFENLLVGPSERIESKLRPFFGLSFIGIFKAQK